MEVSPLILHHHHQHHVQDEEGGLQLHSSYHLPLERHPSQPKVQTGPRLLRQTSRKKVQYINSTPDHHLHQEKGEPPVPKSLRTLRRLKRRVGIGLTATFHYLAQLDDQELIDECGFIYEYDHQVETLVRPAEERVWIAEAEQNGWTLQYIGGNDEEALHLQQPVF